MGILSDKLLWSASPAIAGDDRGFGGFSPAGLNRPNPQTSTGKIANTTSFLDSPYAQAAAFGAGLAVPGLGLGLNAINAAQLHGIENAQRAKLGTTFGKDLDLEPMGFAEALGRAFSPVHDINMSKEAFDKQMAARQKSAAINAEAVAGASGASGRFSLAAPPQTSTNPPKAMLAAPLNYPGSVSQTPAPSLSFGVAPSFEHMSALAADRNNRDRQNSKGGGGSGVGGGSGATGGGFGGRPGRSRSGLGGPDRPGFAGQGF